MSVHTYTNVLDVIECCSCHMDFAMQQNFKRDCKRDHRTFYCPAGHSNYYPGQSDVEKERQARIRAEARAAQAEDRTEVARRQTAAAKGQVTKIKNRVKNGVCPFCSRTFANLAAHMETKHSEDAPHV